MRWSCSVFQVVANFLHRRIQSLRIFERDLHGFTTFYTHDPSAVMFIFKRKQIMDRSSHRNSTKIKQALEDKEKFTNVVERLYWRNIIQSNYCSPHPMAHSTSRSLKLSTTFLCVHGHMRTVALHTSLQTCKINTSPQCEMPQYQGEPYRC